MGGWRGRWWLRQGAQRRAGRAAPRAPAPGGRPPEEQDVQLDAPLQVRQLGMLAHEEHEPPPLT